MSQLQDSRRNSSHCPVKLRRQSSFLLSHSLQLTLDPVVICSPGDVDSVLEVGCQQKDCSCRNHCLYLSPPPPLLKIFQESFIPVLHSWFPPFPFLLLLHP